MKTCQLVRFLEATAEQYSEAEHENRASLVDHAQQIFGRFLAERELSPKYNDQKQLRVLDKVMGRVSERGLPFADSFGFLVRAIIEPRYRCSSPNRRTDDGAAGRKARAGTPPPFYEPPHSADSVLFRVVERPTLSTFLNPPRLAPPAPPLSPFERAPRYAIELARPYLFCAPGEGDGTGFNSDAATCIDPSLLEFGSESSGLGPEELGSLVFVEKDRTDGPRRLKEGSPS